MKTFSSRLTFDSFRWSMIGAAMVVATGIQAYGQGSYTVQTSDGFPHAFRSEGGVMTDLDTVGGLYSFATAINDSGLVTGYAHNDQSIYHAFLSDGTFPPKDLGTLEGYGPVSRGMAINNAGQVTGSSGGRVFRFQGETMIDLGDGEGWVINDFGQIAGITTAFGGGPHAFRVDGTTMINLGSFGGESWPRAINNTGQVVGQAWFPGDAIYHAFLSDGTTMTDLGTFGGSNSAAAAINDSGLVTGLADISGDAGHHAFLFDGTTMMDLARLAGLIATVGLSIARGR